MRRKTRNLAGKAFLAVCFCVPCSCKEYAIAIETPVHTEYRAVAAGSEHTLALKQDGSLMAWGSNVFRETEVPDGNDFVAVSAG